MLDDLTTRDQRMMFRAGDAGASGRQQRASRQRHRNALPTARKHLCQLSTLRWQQKDGLDTVLPYGLRKIQSPTHADYRKHRRVDSVPRAGNHAAERSVLWAERRQQKYDCGRPSLAAQRQQLSVGRVRLRQEHERQGRNRADCAFHRGRYF